MPERSSTSNRTSSFRYDPIGSNRSPAGSKNARVSSTSRLRKRTRPCHGGRATSIFPSNLPVSEILTRILHFSDRHCLPRISVDWQRYYCRLKGSPVAYEPSSEWWMAGEQLCDDLWPLRMDTTVAKGGASSPRPIL